MGESISIQRVNESTIYNSQQTTLHCVKFLWENHNNTTCFVMTAFNKSFHLFFLSRPEKCHRKYHWSFVYLIWFFTSQSTIFQLCWDRSSWVEPVLSKDKCVLLKDTTQWRRWGLNPWSLGLKSSTLPLCSQTNVSLSSLYTIPWEGYLSLY